MDNYINMSQNGTENKKKNLVPYRGCHIEKSTYRTSSSLTPITSFHSNTISNSHTSPYYRNTPASTKLCGTFFNIREIRLGMERERNNKCWFIDVKCYRVQWVDWRRMCKIKNVLKYPLTFCVLITLYFPLFATHVVVDIFLFPLSILKSSLPSRTPLKSHLSNSPPPFFVFFFFV